MLWLPVAQARRASHGAAAPLGLDRRDSRGVFVLGEPTKYGNQPTPPCFHGLGRRESAQIGHPRHPDP
jgi:hypothetical protein